MRSFGVEIQWTGDTVNLRVRGELDIATADGLLERVDAVKRSSARVVSIDLHDVTFMDSSGLRALLSAQRLADAGFEVVVVRPSAPVRAVVAITGADALLRLEADAQSAPAGLA